MATITDKLLILDDSGFPRTVKPSGHADQDSIVLSVDLTAANFNATGTLSVAGETTFSDDVTVNGDLQVVGDIISGGAKDVVTEDNFIDLNNNSQSARSGGITAQVDNSTAFRLDLKPLRAQFLASTATKGPILQVSGDFRNTTGSEGASQLDVQVTGFGSLVAGDTVTINDSSRIVVLTAIANGGVPNPDEFEIGVDNPSTAANLNTAIGLSVAAVATGQLLTATVIGGDTINLTHMVKSRQITFVSSRAGVFTLSDDNKNALGRLSQQQVKVDINLDGADTNRIVLRDSTGGNAISLSANAEFLPGASAAATAQNIFDAFIQAIRSDPANNAYLAPSYDAGGANPDTVFIESAVGGEGQNGCDLTFSNNDAATVGSLTNLAGNGGNITANFINGENFQNEGDVLAIGGLVDGGENNGLFVVDNQPAYDAASNTTDFEFRKSTNSQAPFAQNQFEAFGPLDPSGTEEGTLYVGIKLSVLAASDGSLLDAAGGSIAIGAFAESFASHPSVDSTPNAGREYLSYETFGNVSLQEAYEVGNVITTDASNGDIDFIIGDAADRRFEVATNTNNQGDVVFSNAGGLKNLRHFTGNFASDINLSGGTQTLSADNGQFIIQGQDALVNSIIISENGGAAGDAVLIVGLGAGGTSGGLKLDGGTGEITIDAGAYSDSSMASYAFAPATSFDVESAAVTIGTDNSDASTFTVGEAANLNTILMDAGTGAFDILADAASSIDVSGGSMSVAGIGLTLEAGTAGFNLKGDTDSDIELNGAAAGQASLGIYADNSVGEGIISLGMKSDATAGTDVLGISAELNIIGRIANPTVVGDLATDSYRKPMGVYMLAKSAISIGEVLCLQSNSADQRVQGAEADAAQDNDRRFFGIALEAATNPGDLVACATVAGSIAFVKFDAAPLTADVGKPVYIHTTAGQVSLTAPTASASSVVKVGLLMGDTADANGNYSILIQPQFIAQRP